MPHLLDYVRYSLNFLFFVVSNIYALPTYVTWMGLLTPLRILAPTLYWKIESFVFSLMQGFIVTWLWGYQVLECGDDITLLQDCESLMLCNHQSTADTPLVMLANYNKGMAGGNSLWVMWYIFKYTNFGIVSMMREDFFVHSGKAVRESEVERLKHFMCSTYLDHGRKWVVIFPEGGFLRKRLKANQDFARKNNLPILNHVNLPRVGATQAVLSTVGEPYQPKDSLKSSDSDTFVSNGGSNHNLVKEETDPNKPLKWVIDVTLAYKDGKPLDMVGMCVGSCPRNLITMHYRAYRAKDIPRDTAGLTDWLYQRYVEKEAILAEIYQTGEVSHQTLQEQRLLQPLQPRYLNFDVIQIILIHAFCISSCYLHYTYIFSPMFSFIWAVLSFAF